MFHRNITEFITFQKQRLEQERKKLNMFDDQKGEEKYDSEKSEFDQIEEKENISDQQRDKYYSVDQDQEHEPKMLRYGEFSPNNPKMRVSTQPYLGLGEYDNRREMLMQQRKNEYRQYTADKEVKFADRDGTALRSNLIASKPVSSRDKSVQTDIQDINCPLVQYDYPTNSLEKPNASPRKHTQIETPNKSKYLMDGMQHHDFHDSPKEKYLADLQSSFFPKVMGTPAVNTEDEEKLEKYRRQETYSAELLQQIAEKHRLVEKHKMEELHEQEMAARRLESQMRHIKIDSFNPNAYSNEVNERFQKPSSNWRDNGPRRSDSGLTHHSDPSNRFTSKQSLTNSPPLTRRAAGDKKAPYSFNIPPNSVFANSVPVKDHTKLVYSNNELSTTNKRRIGNLMTRSNSKLDESLPIPVLKAQFPVAKELKNAVAVQSKTSDAMRKLEDKWQIPAVQKNIISDRQIEGINNNNGILTQLGAIRLQLQQEQLRLDETLRKRGTSQTVHADVHRHLNY